MRIKTRELEGIALDWAVAQIELTQELPEDVMVWVTPLPCDDPDDKRYQPSSDWAQGGPIIEQEGMTLRMGCDGHWQAELEEFDALFHGPTPLIAAMRCLVSAKLGDEIEVPNELTR